MCPCPHGFMGALPRLPWSAGFEHTIMVDAPNWGQDWQGVMRANAQTVYDADSTGNPICPICAQE